MQVKAPKEMRLLVKVLMLDVLMMMNVIMLMLMMKVMKVKGLVKVLLEVKVLVEVFVVEAEEVLLFSLSSTPTQTTHPSTRPAARVWASGVKGLGFRFAAPAPGRRCSGPFS